MLGRLKDGSEVAGLYDRCPIGFFSAIPLVVGGEREAGNEVMIVQGP